jgi:hypothetical protein
MEGAWVRPRSMGATVSWRALLLAALTSALIALAVILAPGGPAVGRPSPTRSFGHAQALAHSAAVSSLPLAAQAQISGELAASMVAFRAIPSGDGFQTANRAQGLTASFDRSGVAIAAGSVSLQMSVRAIGSDSSSLPLGQSAPTAHGNRVSYARPQLGEWYRNGPMGIEQGFTISRSPAGADSGPLTLTMSLSGNARATLSRDARSILLRHGQTSLSYGALVATDASGRRLHSWLGLTTGRLLLHVDATGARYPLAIDPLIQKGAKLVGGQEEARFGASAALSADGSTLLIGAPRANASRGAVWVFARSGGEWTKQGEAPLTAPAPVEEPSGEECAEESIDEAGECAFGSSVALSADGNTALIGDPSSTSTAGTAWVFTRSGQEWSRGPALTGAGEGNEGRFGKSVALSADGSLALVGVPSAVSGRGGAWVFTCSGSACTRQLALLDSEASTLAHFGRSVALSGDGSTALVGGPGDSHSTGAAWTFTRNEAAWTQQASKLTGEGESPENSHFGRTVALSADGATALIGAQDDGEERGAVWTFSRSGSTFSQLGAKLQGPEVGGGHFGASLAVSGDGGEALIGAPHTRTGLGSATRFTRSGATWMPRASLGGTEAIGKGWLGSSVALSSDGEVAAVGASRDGKKAGAAWVFSKEALVGPPTIANVMPGRGSTEGGTPVTIEGSNFPDQEEAEEAPPVVMFGSKAARDVEVATAAEIRVVTPESSEGVVDVTVQTASGTSAISTADRFRFESPTKVHGKEKEPTEKGPSDPPQQSPKTSQSPSGGVLGASAAAAGAACRVSLRSKHVVVALHTSAAIRLLRTGSGQCRGTVTLRYKQKLTGKRFKMKSIGGARFSIAPGKSQVVKIKLNKLGQTLLVAGHGKLNASLAVLRTTPVPKLGKTASVRLSVKKTRKAATIGH